MDEWVNEFKQRIEAEETRQNRRIEALETKMDKLIENNAAIQLLGQKLDTVAEDVKKIGLDVENMKSEPADNWKKAVWIVISIIITAVVTAALSGVIK